MPVNIKPAFQAEKITGKFYRPISRIVDRTVMVGHKGSERETKMHGIVHELEEFNEAYMVYFPQGHSMMVAADDTELLQRIGVLANPRLVDMESGEEVPDGFDLTPKELVQRAERNRPRLPTGGLTDIEQEL